MTKVLVYTRFRMTPWWRYIVSQLDVFSESVIVSEFRGDGDHYTMSAFYGHLERPGIEERGVAAFGAAGCREIMARCRLLRILDPALAARMVGAMWQTLFDVVDQHNPDVILSMVVDNYAVDILDRVASAKGIPYVGLSGATLSDRVIVSKRGEHNMVREPDDDEVARALDTIQHPTFAPFLPVRPRYDRLRFAQQVAYSRAREAAFLYLAKRNRDPLNFHYWLPRHKMGYRVRLRDHRVLNYLQDDWERHLEDTPFDRRVFVPLQVQPESTIDYWVRNVEMIDYNKVLVRLARILADEGFVMFVKDHPNMFALRYVELYERLEEIGNVVFVPYSVPAPTLIERCKSVFTCGGTGGLQAALASRTAVVVDSYYLLDGCFVHLPDPESMHEVPDRLRSFVPLTESEDMKLELVRHVLRTCISGDVTSWQNFRADRPESVRRVRSLVEGLDGHLSSLVK
jgi:hypothetical protein